ncbi:TPA: hypothetical protein ACH3X1_007063 [Trebouxia sp. C0004]
MHCQTPEQECVLGQLRATGGAEAASVLRVCVTTALHEAVPVVQAELITLHLSADHRSFGHGPGHHAAIVMPQYVVGLLHSFKRARLQLKLEAKGCYVRLSTCTQNLVHMDVKGENTFVDMTGTGGFVIWALL